MRPHPRDGDPRPCYALLEGDTLTFRPMPYDVDAAVRKIHAVPEQDLELGDRVREAR